MSSSISEQIKKATLEEKEIRPIKYLSFDGEINEDSLSSLCESFNELEIGDELQLYFTSDGGSAADSQAIIHMINTEAFRRPVHLVFPGYIFSGGFDVFLMTIECRKTILPSCYGMLHEASGEMDLLRIKKKAPAEIAACEQIDNINEAAYKRYEKYGVPKELLQQMLEHKDVYLSYEDMQNILAFQLHNGFILDE